MARTFRIVVAAVLAIGIVCSPAGAAPLRTFYVDPAGNDSAAGSATQPWRTLQKAANTVRAGDLVSVRAGHYAGLYLTTSGTATDPITFHGEPGAIVDALNPPRRTASTSRARATW
jgi:Pel9A-like, right handed beta helix region